jgi:hypothetical protein
MTTADEQPEDGDQHETKQAHESRTYPQRRERHADPFPAPITPSRN